MSQHAAFARQLRCEPLEDRRLLSIDTGFPPLDDGPIGPQATNVTPIAEPAAERIGFDGDTSKYLGKLSAIPSGTSYMLTDHWGGSWSDAEKSPTNSEDDLMCWAAAASNILEWTGWGDTGGMADTDQMFEYFQDHWTDLGSLMEFGWDWWFDGTNNSQGWADWSQVDVPGGGFYPAENFSDYYHEQANYSQTMAAVDQYLHAGQGVTLGVYGPGGHAITCWGYNYDSSDTSDYIGVWVTDSDDNKYTTSPPDELRYYEVVFRARKWFLQDFYGSDKWYIGAVQSLEKAPWAQPGDWLEIYATPWNDDNLQSDRDGVVEGWEQADLRLSLWNASTSDVTNVEATLVSSMGEVDIIDGYNWYGLIDAGTSSYGDGEFCIDLNFDSADNVPFQLRVDYTKNGMDYYQYLDFTKNVYWPDSYSFFEVDYHTLEDPVAYSDHNDGNGLFESSETVKIRPYIYNGSVADVLGVEARLLYDGTDLEIYEGWRAYPNIGAESGAFPDYNENGGYDYFSIESVDYGFSGTVAFDVEIQWDGSSTSVVLEDAVELQVLPVPILEVSPRQDGFGVVEPGENITRTMRVYNRGSGLMDVVDIQTSNADTSVPLEDRAFTLAAGEYRDILVTVDTAAIPDGTTILREVQVISPDSRLFDVAAESDRFALEGLVCSALPISWLPGVTDANSPDISGNWIVWSENRDGNYDIFAYNLSTGTEHRVTTDPADQYNPRISGGLIAWEDWRNGGPDQIDIYAYDLDEQVEIIVSNDLATESLVGTDAGRVAFVRHDFSFYEDATPIKGYNVYYSDVAGEVTYQVTSYGTPTPGSTAYRAAPGFDFGESIIAWDQRAHAWDPVQSVWLGSTSDIEKYEIGVDATPAIIPNTDSHTGPVVSESGIVWTQYDSDQQIWKWDGAAQQVTVGTGVNYGDELLAAGSRFVVYEKDSSGLFYWDLDAAANPESLLANDIDNFQEARMGGNGVVWRGQDPGSGEWRLYYTFLGQPDLSISSADIAFSDESPVEGQTIDVSATVHNLTTTGTTADITVGLYDDDPNAGGTRLAPDQMIYGGIAGQGSGAVVFNAVPAGLEGPHDVWVLVEPLAGENPSNNTAFRVLDARDDDTGPDIASVVVEEYGGDGDGIIGSDEEIRISWELSDPSGLASTELWVDLDGDGPNPPEQVPLDGDYYATFGPLVEGIHGFTIYATDADNSPAVSEYTSSFGVGLLPLVDVALIPVLIPSPPTLPGSELPDPADEVVLGGTYYVEVWVQDTGAPSAGIAGGSVDVHYTTSRADAVSIANLDFNTTPSGSIDDPSGLVDNLGGLTYTSDVGVAPDWARLGYIELVCTDVGDVVFDLSPGNVQFSRSGAGNVDWIQVDLGDIVTVGQIAEARIDMTLVRQPTAFDEEVTGEVDALPGSEPWVHEWESYWMELWVSTPDIEGFGVSGGIVDLQYDTGIATADLIEWGPAFTSNQTGTIDDAAGLVNDVGADTLRTDAGDDRFALLARIRFTPDPGDQAAVDEISHFIGPYDLGITLDDGRVELSNIGPVDNEFGMLPSTNLFAVPFDIDDDNTIDAGDWAVFMPAFDKSVGEAEPPYTWWADLDKTGLVDFGDLSYLAPNLDHSKPDDGLVFPPSYPDAWQPIPTTPVGVPAGDVEGDVSALVTVQLVALSAPTSSDEAAVLPTSLTQVSAAETYYVEIWVQDNGTTGAGISGGLITIDYTTSQADGTGMDHGGIFNTFARGDIDDPEGRVTDFGGGAMDGGIGVASQWARLGFVEYVAISDGLQAFNPSPGSLSFARYGEGNVAWQDVLLKGCVFNTLPGDASGDGTVDQADAAIVAGNWLKQTGATWTDGDFNDDRRVDDRDAAIMAANWGRTLPPATSASAATETPVTEPETSYDLDNNGKVDLGDLALFASVYREKPGVTTESPYAYAADYDRSGTIDLGDLAFFAANYQQGQASSPVPKTALTAAAAPAILSGDANRDGAVDDDADQTILARHWMMSVEDMDDDDDSRDSIFATIGATDDGLWSV